MVGRKGEVGKIVAFEAVATIALQIHAKVYHMVAGIVCFVAVNTRESVDDGSFGGEEKTSVFGTKSWEQNENCGKAAITPVHFGVPPLRRQSRVESGV